MDTEFDYISYANAFNVKVQYDGSDVTFERIYGSPGYETPEQGILCKIVSNFPTIKEDSTTKGGIIIIKFSRNNKQATELKFTTTYTDAFGTNYNDSHIVTLPETNVETYYEGTAVHKGVLLTRFVTLMRSFLEDKIPSSDPTELGEWKPKMEKFKNYYVKEADTLRDENLLNELKLINLLLEVKKETETEVKKETEPEAELKFTTNVTMCESL